MAITLPNSTPANYSDPAITRYGLISGLNIVNVHASNTFYDTFGWMPYTSLSELLGDDEESTNKEFRWYQSHGRPMGFVTSSGVVTVANGAPATITVGADSYSQAGTKSLPALGFIFYNARTGVNSRVSAVPNKATPNAHTFVLTPLKTTENASTLAGDELLGRGFLYLGEQSDTTDTVIRNIDRYSNYVTEIRADDTITDLADAEKIEFQINGNYSFTYKQMRDTNLRLMREKDFLIFEGTQANNLPYAEEGSNGVIKQVQANGINMDYATWNLATFATIDRALNSVGAPKEYDILSDSSAMIEMQNSIFTEINNGGIVYAAPAGSRGGINLERDFQSLKIYSRKYNFTNYGLFDEQTVYGSKGLGLRNRFSLFMPTGKTSSARENGSTVTMPRFSVMYQRPFGMANSNKWHVGESGLFASQGGTSGKADRKIHTIGYFGARVIGAQQYMIAKGN